MSLIIPLLPVHLDGVGWCYIRFCLFRIFVVVVSLVDGSLYRCLEGASNVGVSPPRTAAAVVGFGVGKAE
jgi:uncharacterized SAM-binding protein YcdF (DUF218 family)